MLGEAPTSGRALPRRNTAVNGEGGIRTLERGFPRYAISSRARSTAPAPLPVHASPILRPTAAVEGYDTCPSGVARLPSVLLAAASPAFSKTIGLIATFGGIGVIVNVIIVYIAIQIRGERRQNQEYLASRRPPGS